MLFSPGVSVRATCTERRWDGDEVCLMLGFLRGALHGTCTIFSWHTVVCQRNEKTILEWKEMGWRFLEQHILLIWSTSHSLLLSLCLSSLLLFLSCLPPLSSSSPVFSLSLLWLLLKTDNRDLRFIFALWSVPFTSVYSALIDVSYEPNSWEYGVNAFYLYLVFMPRWAKIYWNHSRYKIQKCLISLSQISGR